MKAKITHVTLVVNNQQAAVDFYTQKVGFEKKADIAGPNNYRWVTVGPEGDSMEISLFPVGFRNQDGSSSTWRPGNTPPIIMNVDDIKKTFDDLKSRGVQFKQEKPDETPWSITAVFSDPDGNLFQINQMRNSQSWTK